MNINTMRAVDRFAGIPLCWLAGLWRRHAPGRRRPEPVESWRTVVVIKMFGLGSVLLAAPVLGALHAKLPGARVVFVSFAENRELLDRLPGVDRTLTIRTASPWLFLRDTLAVLRSLRAMDPDAVFDLEFFSKFSTLLSALSASPRRFAYDLPARWRRLTTTDPVPYSHTKHITDVFLDQLPFAPPSGVSGTQPRLSVTADDCASLARKLGTGGDVVCMNINAGPTSLERRWPAERFASLAERYLRQFPDSTLLLTGSAPEAPYVEAMLRSAPRLEGRARNLAGQLSLGEFLALLARSNWFLTNDSGPMHLAAAVSCPVIALFGPESPAFYAPRSSAIIHYAGIPCSPCLNVYHAKYFSCPYHARCMREISGEQVFASIRKLEDALRNERLLVGRTAKEPVIP